MKRNSTSMRTRAKQARKRRGRKEIKKTGKGAWIEDENDQETINSKKRYERKKKVKGKKIRQRGREIKKRTRINCASTFLRLASLHKENIKTVKARNLVNYHD